MNIDIERTEQISNTVGQLAGSAAIHGSDHGYIQQHLDVIEAGLRASEARVAELEQISAALYGALNRLLGELPTRRDWLDPVTEAMARNAISAARATESGEPQCCGHASDCAVHNEPAMPAGKCNCGKGEIPVLEPITRKCAPFTSPEFARFNDPEDK